MPGMQKGMSFFTSVAVDTHSDGIGNSAYSGQAINH